MHEHFVPDAFWKKCRALIKRDKNIAFILSRSFGEQEFFPPDFADEIVAPPEWQKNALVKIFRQLEADIFFQIQKILVFAGMGFDKLVDKPARNLSDARVRFSQETRIYADSHGFILQQLLDKNKYFC